MDYQAANAPRRKKQQRPSKEGKVKTREMGPNNNRDIIIKIWRTGGTRRDRLLLTYWVIMVRIMSSNGRETSSKSRDWNFPSTAGSSCRTTPRADDLGWMAGNCIIFRYRCNLIILWDCYPGPRLVHHRPSCFQLCGWRWWCFINSTNYEPRSGSPWTCQKLALNFLF